jgi:hypothetical protein
MRALVVTWSLGGNLPPLRSTRDDIDALRPDLMVSDCMLPAAPAAGEAAATRNASVVHFLYGLARQVMLEAGGGWTTDLHTLTQTRSALELAPLESGLAAWERPDLVLVTAPAWLDIMQRTDRPLPATSGDSSRRSSSPARRGDSAG